MTIARRANSPQVLGIFPRKPRQVLRFRPNRDFSSVWTCRLCSQRAFNSGEKYLGFKQSIMDVHWPGRIQLRGGLIPQLAGSTPSLFEGLKGAALESCPRALAKHGQEHHEAGAGQRCPAESTCVAESPSLTAVAFHTHRAAAENHLRHSGQVSKDSGRVPCLGFQSRVLPLQLSSCALPAGVCLHRKLRSHLRHVLLDVLAACSSSPSGSVLGLWLSTAPVPG